MNAGEQVRTGDVLIALDARDIGEHARQARAGALAAEKSLERAGTDRSAAAAEHRLALAWQKRIGALHARNSATDQEHDEAEARLAAAAARLAGAEAGIDVAEANIASAAAAVAAAEATESFATIRAAFDGLVTERLADPGSLAAPGVPLLRIDAVGPRQVVVRVDEARAAYVRAGDRVTVEIDPPAGEAVEGVVGEVSRLVDADLRAFTVKVAVPRSVTARSGSFARVVFRGAPRRALVVPASAIRRQGQVASLFVARDGVAHLRLIQPGAVSSAGVEVLAGLDAGESVVTPVPAHMTDGASVTIDGAPARAEGPS